MGTLSTVCVTLTILWLVQRTMKRRSQLPLPPTPKGLPLIGNLLDMPTHFPWEKYDEWCKELNTDILHLHAVGQHVIVLNSFEVAFDLLDKQALSYSDRPRMPMISELMGWDWFLGFKNYTDEWKVHRKMMMQSFNPTAVNRFMPHVKRATRNMLNRFLNEPDKLEDNLRSMAAETILSVTYGIKIQQKDDFFMKTAAQGVAPVLEVAGAAGLFLVDSLPVLKYIPSWFPGADFKRKAEEWKKLAEIMIEVPFEAAKTDIANGTPYVSVISESLQRLEEKDQSTETVDDIVKLVAAGLYAAGTETTVSPVVSCMLALLLNQDVLKRAQVELDSVVKPGNLPELSDRPFLPFVTAIAHEAMRWRDVAPQAIPHSSTIENEYKGYRIPAGAVVIPNSWAMLHDEKVYPDPFKFNPDRFMKDGELDLATQPDPSFACWGYGRRKCPGQHMAAPAVWMAIAHLIFAFDLEKAKDENGNEITPPEEYSSGLTIMAKPFQYVLRPRTKEIEELIKQNLNSDVDGLYL